MPAVSIARVLGIQMGHDASVSVVEGGAPVFCASEERFTREKGSRGFPIHALHSALAFHSTSPDDYTRIAIATEELAQRFSRREMQQQFRTGASRRVMMRILLAERMLAYFFGRRAAQTLLRDVEGERSHALSTMYDELRRIGFDIRKVRFYEHHFCHAIAAFELSPFQDALVVTSDGRGDGVSATLGFASAKSYQRVAAVPDSSSLGQLYGAVTAFLGFRYNRHEGKITGLAAYGDPRRLGDQLVQLLHWAPDGTYRVRLPVRFTLASTHDIDHFLRSTGSSFKDRLLLHGQRDLASLVYKANWLGMLRYLASEAQGVSPADVAAGIQWMIEHATTKLIQGRLTGAPQDVALSGGLFSNVSVNRRVSELPGVARVFVQPAMGDDGLSVGAALAAGRELHAGDARRGVVPRTGSIGHTYLGPAYSAGDFLVACEREGVRMTPMQCTQEWTARCLAAGLIVGLYAGRMEFGPRALGHRSILADPRKRDLNAVLNRRLRRTEFMPFAPSLLAEHAHAYLQQYRSDQAASEYMTMTYEVSTQLRLGIPAVVHIDGTARPHVVRADRAPRLHQIIAAFHRLTGIPVLVNTSFNMHEEPIVCSPRDAVRALKAGCVDVLVVEDAVVSLRNSLPRMTIGE